MKLIEQRLTQATTVELNRLRGHLSLDETSSSEDILREYQQAGENTLVSLTRSMTKSAKPSYQQILVMIYRKLRSVGEAFDETWSAVKSLKFWNHVTDIDRMTTEELENLIFELYAAEYKDANNKAALDPGFLASASKYIPGLTGASTGAAVTLAATTATRLPFASLAPGLVVGPAGIAMSVILMGVQASGPAFRKIVPVTMELILIGRRVEFMPED